MLGYVVAVIAIICCFIFSYKVKRKAFLRSERIIHAIPDMVFILDNSLNILKIYNPDSFTLLAPSEQITGKNLREFFPEKDYAIFKKGVDDALKTESTIEIEYSLSIDSELHFFEARYLKIDDSRVTCVIRNITKRKKKDIIIEQNQQFLKTILDHIPFPVMLKDIENDFRYIYWNNECNRQSGYQRDEILGKTDIDLYGVERGGGYLDIDRKIVAEGKLYSAEEEFITPDGICHNTIVTKSIITNDIYSWLLVVRRDVSEFVQIQNALEETNHLNRLILDNSNAGFIFIRPDYVVEWENVSRNLPSVVSLAYKMGEKCYCSAKGMDHVCPGCILEEAILSGEIKRKELPFSKDIIVEVIATPVWDKNKELKGTVLRIEDITGKKKVEQELRQAKEDAEKSDRLKSAFLANISHEIRTPLNAIVGFSDLLCHTKEVDEQKKYIQIIQRNNELLLQLISDILDFSKIESDTCDFVFSLIDIHQLFKDLKDLIIFKMLPSEGIEIIVKPCPEHCMIYTEKGRLMQVLENLCSNAIKFTEKGKIVIGFEIREKDIYFYVSDTGIGIPQDKQEVIFKRFIKLDSFKNGTGLGLSICQSIIHKLDGEIGVESNPGEGAKFWFTLPYDSLIKKDV